MVLRANQAYPPERARDVLKEDVVWDMWENNAPVKEEPMTLYASLMESLEESLERTWFESERMNKRWLQHLKQTIFHEPHLT